VKVTNLLLRTCHLRGDVTPGAVLARSPPHVLPWCRLALWITSSVMVRSRRSTESELMLSVIGATHWAGRCPAPPAPFTAEPSPMLAEQPPTASGGPPGCVRRREPLVILSQNCRLHDRLPRGPCDRHRLGGLGEPPAHGGAPVGSTRARAWVDKNSAWFWPIGYFSATPQGRGTRKTGRTYYYDTTGGTPNGLQLPVETRKPCTFQGRCPPPLITAVVSEGPSLHPERKNGLKLMSEAQGANRPAATAPQECGPAPSTTTRLLLLLCRVAFIVGRHRVY